MSYFGANGKFVDEKAIDLRCTDGLTLSADGVSAVLEAGEFHTLNLTLAVSSVSSADTLDVTIQGSSDKTNWYTLGAFTQVTAAGTQRKAFQTAKYVRVNYDVTGAAIAIAYTLTGTARG